MFDFVKKVYRINKNKNEINTRLNRIEGTMKLWLDTDYGTLTKALASMTANSMDVVLLSFFPYNEDRNFDETKILVAFWYLYFYIGVRDDNFLLDQNSDVDSRVNCFESIYHELVDDLFDYQGLIRFSKSKKYYREQLEIYFKYHNFHKVPTNLIGTEMSQNVVNLLSVEGENKFSKISDVKQFFEMVLPEFEKGILKEHST